MTTTNKRTPRPLGTTEIGRTLNKDQDNVDIQTQLQLHIIRHYIQNNFTYCHTPMSIEQLSHYTGIPNHLITEAIIQTGQATFNLLDREDQANSFRAILGLTINSALADSQRALEQYAILKASQGNSYKAFISGEVNKALKLTQESTAQMLNIYKAMAGNSALNVVINNNQQQNIQTNNYLTADSALEIINSKDESLPLLENPELKDALYHEHGLDDTPEVRAINQTGLDTSKEALNLRTLAQVSEALVNDLEGPKSHIDRRAIEIDWDLEDDDL